MGEGVPLLEGFAVDLLNAPVERWERFDANGAVVNVKGRGDFLDLWLLEVPAGGRTAPQHHLFEAIVYVISGNGSTTIDADGTTHSFEWGPSSMFALPLNARYQMLNGAGDRTARLAMTTAFPITMNLFHNDEFIFGSPFPFAERYGSTDAFGGSGHSVTDEGSEMKYEFWETNFVPDLTVFDKLRPLEYRGKASSSIMFLIADGVLHAHMSEIPKGRYKKAHRHIGGTHIYPVSGEGYSLLWYEGEEERIRIDWRHGWVYSPPDMMYHQHFNVSDAPSRYFAVKMGNHRYPVTQLMANQWALTQADLKEAKHQIDYEDESPAIGALYRKELAARGLALAED